VAVGACSGQQDDGQSAGYTHRQVTLSLFDPSSGLARRLNKRLDSVRFHYILLYVCAESSFVYGNNSMLLYKNACSSLIPLYRFFSRVINSLLTYLLTTKPGSAKR